MLSFTVVKDTDLIKPGDDSLKTFLIDSQKKFLSDNQCNTPNNLCQTVANIAKKSQ